MHIQRIPLIVAPVLLALLTGTASAGLFGGFGEEGHYRRGDKTICAAQPHGSGASSVSCESKSTGEMATLSFTRGLAQRGALAEVFAKKESTAIKVYSSASELELECWDSQEVVGNIGQVFLSADRRWVAIEFESRFAGRSVDELVVLSLSVPDKSPGSMSGKSPESPPSSMPESGTKNIPTPANPAESPEFRKALKQGIAWSRTKRTYAKAETSLLRALNEIPGHPQALYRLALLHYKRKQVDRALATLEKLAASKHLAMPRWRVEARTDLRFKDLRGDSRFRAAVGITRTPGAVVSLYERLVALGGRWEQEGIPCEEAQVNLRLRRAKKQRFALVIRSKCQGSGETTRLDGTWAAKGASSLVLSLPNQDKAADLLTCKVEVCTDESSEDCLRCAPDPESEFLLRIVRR